MISSLVARMQAFGAIPGNNCDNENTLGCPEMIVKARGLDRNIHEDISF